MSTVDFLNQGWFRPVDLRIDMSVDRFYDSQTKAPAFQKAGKSFEISYVCSDDFDPTPLMNIGFYQDYINTVIGNYKFLSEQLINDLSNEFIYSMLIISEEILVVTKNGNIPIRDYLKNNRPEYFEEFPLC